MNFNFLVPQALTASRIAFGGGAVAAAIHADANLAATLITLGAVTDGLDGPIARMLGVSSDFGAIFDYFSDYLCYVVAPSILSLTLFNKPGGLFSIVVFSLPLLTGAIRYARNGLRLRNEDFAEVGFPGLGTVIYGFFIVTVTFIRPEGFMSPILINRLMLCVVLLVSCLMVLPVRYPKLMKYKWISAVVLPGFILMPFFLTRILAAITLALGCVYTFVSPFFMRHPAVRGTPGRLRRNGESADPDRCV